MGLLIGSASNTLMVWLAPFLSDLSGAHQRVRFSHVNQE